MLKKILSSRLKRKIKEDLGVPSLHWSLENLKRKNFDPSFILDIGAYEGLWTIDVLEVFPTAKILMVEAQKNKEPFLQKIKQRYPNTEYAISLLSSKDGEEKLFMMDETDSHISDEVVPGRSHDKIVTQSLDKLLEEKGLPYPQFMKLDVQGHELEVLKGASGSLAHAELCLLEVSLLDLGNKNPLLAEMVAFMDEKQFQVYDISHFMRRPFDKALYQLDIFFIKKDSTLIENKRWA